MNPDRKVYDSDLVLTPSLRAIATAYVEEYVGNFSMMIEAKRYLFATGSLEEAMVRPVLNTLRCDPLHQDLWGAVRVLLHPIERRESTAKVVPIRASKRSRKVILDMATTIKKPYGIAPPSGTARRVVHHVQPEARLRWHRPTKHRYGDWDFTKRLEPDDLLMWWLCKRGPSRPILLDEIPEGMDECRKCHCIANGLEYL